MDTNQIRKINPKIITEDGRIASFKEQLFDVISGTYDTTYPLVVSGESKCLQYIEGINENYPIVFRPGKVFKLVNDHQLDYAFIGNLEKEISNSVFAFDSRSEEKTKVLLLDKKDLEGNRIIVAIQTNQKAGYVSVNRVASAYGKRDIERFLTLTYDEDYKFYKNQKTGQFIVSNKLQLPTGLITALSDNNYRQTFTKSQVEAEITHNVKKGSWLQTIKTNERKDEQEELKRSTTTA